ncbi:MAG TPA: orotidine-5'-phosphate decarboxylase [Candidatus Ventricola gallistercoris]|nr:orotidine-5'-phosphate decarboxylase [Candidatus Ventricola gallistercoris]
MEQLAARIRAMKNPTVAGLDTRIEYLPESFVNEILPQGIHTFEDAAEAVYRYNVRLIDALCDIVPSVKVQVAYYEMYGPAGMVAYDKTIRYAKEKGMIVMADVKRNDIGATAACYANAYIGTTDMPDGAQRAFAADIATINPYLGVDGVKPFADACRDHGTGIFVLVKTSNPSSGQLQDMRFEDGRTLYEAVADLVEQWGEETRGESGYSAVGAVVGATYPQQGTALRARMPHAFFLVPGYGAQGATGADIAGCFDANGSGAIVNASRSILCAWKKREGMTFDEAARAEAIRMREDLCGCLKAAGKEIR